MMKHTGVKPVESIGLTGRWHSRLHGLSTVVSLGDSIAAN
jgi:hypothetical protein